MKKKSGITPNENAAADADVEITRIGSVSPEDFETVRRILLALGKDVLGCRVHKGPRVVRMALELRRGVRYSRIVDLANSVLLDLRIHPARIEAPIPGQDCVGIEFACTNPDDVKFSDFAGREWHVRRMANVRKTMLLPVVFGKGVDGSDIVEDLAAMPHMLVGGAPGQAPTFLHSVICGFAASRTPEEVQFIIADPRVVELAPYAKLPNLVVPVITDMRKIVFSLHWAVAEMENRLKMFAQARTRNIEDFNSRDANVSKDDGFGDDVLTADLPATLPYIVIVISDFDAVMENAGKEVLCEILRITQKARAAGIHLVLETKWPDKKALPRALMANVPVRVAFKVASEKESKLILDEEGAETLLGQGDALVRGSDGIVRRVQTPSISDEEIDAVVADCAKAAEKIPLSDDVLLSEDCRMAVEVVVKTQEASISNLQRQLGWGYNHAARIMDLLTENGVVGAPDGRRPRKILVDALPEPQMTRVIMKVCVSGDDLRKLRKLASEKGCDVDDIVSELVRERLASRA
ncbi:MAG: DNA translocase FtsK [Kiritimatiellae bacterium]|nr:DNA translocase FtsK [Kiritimatiellia bacterium]